MFGYVRPAKPELKCKDFDLYKATYCGLCRCLRARYGLIAPLLLNFDFTFLALALWEPEGQPSYCRGRCHANLLLKKQMCPNSPALDTSATMRSWLASMRARSSARPRTVTCRAWVTAWAR